MSLSLPFDHINILAQATFVNEFRMLGLSRQRMVLLFMQDHGWPIFHVGCPWLLKIGSGLATHKVGWTSDTVHFGLKTPYLEDMVE